MHLGKTTAPTPEQPCVSVIIRRKIFFVDEMITLRPFTENNFKPYQKTFIYSKIKLHACSSALSHDGLINSTVFKNWHTGQLLTPPP